MAAQPVAKAHQAGSANVGIGMLAVLFAVGFVLFRVSCRTEGAKQV